MGCKKDIPEQPNPEPDPIADLIVAENTIVVDEQTRQIITAIDTTNFSFTFNGSSAIIDSLQVGDILVDSTSAQAPYGYLRKVTSISSTKDGEPKLYKTLDGGHTWEPMIDTRAKHGMSKVFFLGQDFGVVSGKGPYVFRYSVGK